MAEDKDRKELEQRLAQAKRIAAAMLDPLTRQRLERLIQELEEQLRLSESDDQ
jgi:hypothetical protein